MRTLHAPTTHPTPSSTRRVDVYVTLTQVPAGKLGGILGDTYPALLPAAAGSGVTGVIKGDL